MVDGVFVIDYLGLYNLLYVFIYGLFVNNVLEQVLWGECMSHATITIHGFGSLNLDHVKRLSILDIKNHIRELGNFY